MKAKLVKESLRENIGPVDYTDSDGSGGYSTHPAYNQKAPREKGSKAEIPEFTTGWEVISFLEDIPEFKEYANEDAQYDDEWYSIPATVFKEVLGWTAEEVEAINYELESYEGSISWEVEQPESYEERGPVKTWKPIPIEDQRIIVNGGA